MHIPRTAPVGRGTTGPFGAGPKSVRQGDEEAARPDSNKQRENDYTGHRFTLFVSSFFCCSSYREFIVWGFRPQDPWGPGITISHWRRGRTLEVCRVYTGTVEPRLKGNWEIRYRNETSREQKKKKKWKPRNLPIE